MSPTTMVYLSVAAPTVSVFATEADFDEFTLTDSSVHDRLETLLAETHTLHSR